MPLLLREAIGGTIRRARTERRRTLRDVSREARVSLGYLSEVERGRKEPSSELLASICDALALSLPDLLDDVAESMRPTPDRMRRTPRPVALARRGIDPALRTAVEEAFEAGADEDTGVAESADPAPTGGDAAAQDAATAPTARDDAVPAVPAAPGDHVPAPDDGTDHPTVHPATNPATTPAAVRLVPLVTVGTLPEAAGSGDVADDADADGTPDVPFGAGSVGRVVCAA